MSEPHELGSDWAVETDRTRLAVAVLDASPDAIAVLDEVGTIVAVNHTWRMFALDNGGSEETTGVGVNYLDVCGRSASNGCADAERVGAELRAVLAGDMFDAEIEYPCPSPSVRRWFMLRTNRLRGTSPGAILSHVNITRRKMAEEELAHAASHDPLTGLANRNLFNRQLGMALASVGHDRSGPDVGLLYIDLDGFKLVNDTYGHGAGDEVLLTVASRLRRLVRPGTTLGRFGGDEFGVIAPRIDAAGLRTLALRVEDSLDQPHLVHGRSVPVGSSVGRHLAAVGDDAEAALSQADAAMYANKQRRQPGRSAVRSRQT